MLFRPPDLDFHSVDRIAFGLLVFLVLLRALLLHEAWRPPRRIVLPMVGLCLLVLTDLVSRPFEIQMWSVAAAKYFVPYMMFFLAGVVFRDSARVRHFEFLLLLVLAYLIYLALASLAHLDGLIFPKYILDPGLGLNAMRARGPFLQPVANGAALNMLGLIAFDSFERKRLRGASAWILLGGLPVAVLATLTRSVWLGFGISVILLLRWTHNRWVRRVCTTFVIAGALTLLAAVAENQCDTPGGRLRDQDTVDFRLAAYRAGWTMFEEHPLLGWGSSVVQTELADRIEGFKGDVFVVHNTYFEILLEHGVVGCAMFAWLIAGLVGIGRRTARIDGAEEGGFLEGRAGRRLWLLLLSVYFINATFVVMNYQFVNGLLFTVAGILAMRQQRGEATAMCEVELKNAGRRFGGD